MFTRALAAIVFATAIGVVLLSLRQQRLAMMHDMAKLRDQMDVSRQQTWDMQVRIAAKIDPPRLAKAIERAKLKVEPNTPGSAGVITGVAAGTVPETGRANSRLTAAGSGASGVSGGHPAHGTDD